MGSRPERMAQISREHWTMENVKKHFAEKRNDLYAQSRLANTEEEKQGVIRDMQRFHMEAGKYRGVIPPIAARSLRRQLPKGPRSRLWRSGIRSPRNTSLYHRIAFHDMCPGDYAFSRTFLIPPASFQNSIHISMSFSKASAKISVST